jgi:hypothetical protein
VRLANGDLPQTKRLLLAKVFGRSRTEEDLVEGLCGLRDDGSGVPYELVRSIEDVFLERRPYGTSGNAYALSPLGCNTVRRRLFEMAVGDPGRKAFCMSGRLRCGDSSTGVPQMSHGIPSSTQIFLGPPLLN